MNKLIFAPSFITELQSLVVVENAVGAKSPLTGAFRVSEAEWMLGGLTKACWIELNVHIIK